MINLFVVKSGRKRRFWQIRQCHSFNKLTEGYVPESPPVNANFHLKPKEHHQDHNLSIFIHFPWIYFSVEATYNVFFFSYFSHGEYPRTSRFVIQNLRGVSRADFQLRIYESEDVL